MGGRLVGLGSSLDSALLQYHQILRLSAPDSNKIELFNSWVNKESEGVPILHCFENFLRDQLPQISFEFSKTERKEQFKDDDATDLATLTQKADSKVDEFLRHSPFFGSVYLVCLTKQFSISANTELTSI